MLWVAGMVLGYLQKLRKDFEAQEHHSSLQRLSMHSKCTAAGWAGLGRAGLDWGWAKMGWGGVGRVGWGWVGWPSSQKQRIIACITSRAHVLWSARLLETSGLRRWWRRAGGLWPRGAISTTGWGGTGKQPLQGRMHGTSLPRGL